MHQFLPICDKNLLMNHVHALQFIKGIIQQCSIKENIVHVRQHNKFRES